jgi:hypothetical protein
VQLTPLPIEITMRPLRCCAALIAFVLTTEAAAFAQPAPAAPPPTDVRANLTEQARKAWDSGKILVESGDNSGALVEFRRAYELSSNPRVLFNVGVVEKLLNHYARATAAWEQEQTALQGKLTPAEVTELKNVIAAVQQYVTTLDVTANESDATLTIDDYVVGKTPFAGPVKIDVGHHTVKLSKPGFTEDVQQVDLGLGQKGSKTFKLVPQNQTALVSVTVSGAPTAEVWVDGKDMGPAPFKGELKAERHTIEARATGFVTVGQTVEIQYGQPMSLVLSLAQERHEAKLTIKAPEGAEIAIDQKKVGVGSWEGLVSTTGGHQIVVTKPGLQAYTTDVMLADDQTREVDAVLNAEVSTSWVAWGVGTLLLVTGGIVAGYYIFKPTNPSPFQGDLNPYLQTASHGFHF